MKESIDLVSLLLAVAGQIKDKDRTGSCPNDLVEYILGRHQLIALLNEGQKAKNSEVYHAVIDFIDSLG